MLLKVKIIKKLLLNCGGDNFIGMWLLWGAVHEPPPTIIIGIILWIDTVDGFHHGRQINHGNIRLNVMYGIKDKSAIL